MKVVDDGYTVKLMSEDGTEVAGMNSAGDVASPLETAAHIVKAVNSHDALVAALRDLMAQCRKYAPTLDRQRGRDALKLAGDDQGPL